MEVFVQGRGRSKAWVEAILPSMIEQLKINKFKKVLIVKITNDCNGNEGFAVDLTEEMGCYLVAIKPRRNLISLGIALAHEMVHIKQLLRGTLKNAGDGANYWNGKFFGSNTKYLARPWEIEAYAKQELIFRRAIEE